MKLFINLRYIQKLAKSMRAECGSLATHTLSPGHCFKLAMPSSLAAHLNCDLSPYSQPWLQARRDWGLVRRAEWFT